MSSDPVTIKISQTVRWGTARFSDCPAARAPLRASVGRQRPGVRKKQGARRPLRRGAHLRLREAETAVAAPKRVTPVPLDKTGTASEGNLLPAMEA